MPLEVDLGTLEAGVRHSLVGAAYRGSREVLLEGTVLLDQTRASQASQVASLRAFLEVACRMASALLP